MHLIKIAALLVSYINGKEKLSKKAHVNQTEFSRPLHSLEKYLFILFFDKLSITTKHGCFKSTKKHTMFNLPNTDSEM